MTLPTAPAHSAPAALHSRSFTTSDGVRLRYLEGGVEGGRGPLLLFATGWLLPAEIWRPQLDHFARTHRVVALDPRSQGGSEVSLSANDTATRARDLHELLGALGAEHVVAVGWSLGVLELLTVAQVYGEGRLAALVLVDNSVGEQPPPEPTGFLGRYQADRRAGIEEMVRECFRLRSDPALERELVEQALRTPMAVSLDMLRRFPPRDYWRDALYGFRKPVLYAVTPLFRGQAEAVKARRPEAWIEVFEHAGHALFADEPERFNALLERFIRTAVRTSPAGSAAGSAAHRGAVRP
ncbi:MAG: alpha/beta fold hydrolase [Candidatus Lambdaproteobacteria bacterium]|nr:alpha/beta fold hydrolase [Candidatus Lambdaproteobacteria bacterium]